MIHPDTELRFVTPDIGNGVFATRFIPKGTLTWVRDRLDQTFTPEDVEQALARRAPASITRNYVDVAALLGAHPSLARRT